MVLTPPAAGVHFDSCRLGPECCGLSGPKRRLTGLREHKTGSSSSSNSTQPGTDSPAGVLTRRGRRHFARLGTHIYERAAGPAAAASASVQHGCRRKRFQQASAECLCPTHWAEPRTGAPLFVLRKPTAQNAAARGIQPCIVFCKVCEVICIC